MKKKEETIQPKTSLIATVCVFIAIMALSASTRAADKPGAAESKTSVADASKKDFEAQVERYIRLFPQQDTYNYAKRYTGGDPSKLNTWVLGKEPKLVRAGEDTIVRMNNDTFYKMAFILLEDKPIIVESKSPSKKRFNSFQLMDDRNVNYRNIIHPSGEYTFYYGKKPKKIRGKGIKVPTRLSTIGFRVELKDKNSPDDVAAAKAVFNGITIRATPPAKFPTLDLLSGFSDDVVKEANRRMDEALKSVPFSKLVVGPGQKPGVDVPHLYHAAGTKGGWGGPATSHSAYEGIFVDENGEELRGSKGTYTLTTKEPPVDAFWSVTVYDTDQGGHFHPNKHDRYHINNTTAVKNADGTVTFTFKTSCQDSDKNCLEVPKGRFDVVPRYYLPHKEIRTGSWTMPKIKLQKN